MEYPVWGVPYIDQGWAFMIRICTGMMTRVRESGRLVVAGCVCLAVYDASRTLT